MAVIEINEEWVKDRVKIIKEKLDDIKSLSLPGTFDEKIVRLGSALLHFTRLKELDLSRNVLENLDGLSHLKCLENLNLYYNNVGSLKELYKLRNNQKLIQLDLRLNPVARNEADYRLCLIHMLPLLIRLDDRCVKDEERKASLMYFGSDQSREFSPHNKSDELESSIQLPTVLLTKSSSSSTPSHVHRKTHPRVEMVNRWTKGISTDNYFDKDNLNLENGFRLNLNDWNGNDDNISAPRELEMRTVKEYSPKERLDVERELSSIRHAEESGNFSTVYVRSDDKLNSTNKCHKTSPSAFSLYKTHFSSRAHGDGFGINIVDQGKPNSFNENSPMRIREQNDNPVNCIPVNENVEEDFSEELIDKICDLVDRYWNGSRSLHQNPKFIDSIKQIISSYCTKKSSNICINNISKTVSRKATETKPSITKHQMENKPDSKNELAVMKLANEKLQDQIRDLRHKLNISEKFSEITELLKQSHESLINTNEHLRKQLENQDKQNSLKNEK